MGDPVFCDDIMTSNVNTDRTRIGSESSNNSAASSSTEKHVKRFSRRKSKSFRKYSIPEDCETISEIMSDVRQWAQKQSPPGGGNFNEQATRTLPPRGRRSKRRMRLMSMYSDESKQYGDKTQLDDVISEYNESENGNNGYLKTNEDGKPVLNGQLNNNDRKNAKNDTKIRPASGKVKKDIYGHDLNTLRIGDLPWGARWLAFTESVSIVGLRHAVDPQASNLRRLVWCLFILLGIGFMTYQIYER